MADDQSPSAPAFRVFISYRHDEASGYALGLQEHLEERFGSGSVFMDVYAIHAGSDFADVIHEALEDCDVFLALIGRTWSSCVDAFGNRRLNDPEDFVRLEVETALRRGIHVIPLLVQGASVPSRDDLPPSLSTLARHQALELSDRRWHDDLNRLLEELDHLAATGGLSWASRESPTSAPVHNLPASLDSFVGRDREVTTLTRTLPTTRLLTLVGTGGIGKTRLAVQVAETLLSQHRDGVWFVDLSARDDPAGVAAEMAAAVGAKEAGGRSTEDVIVAHLRSKDALIVLDNCEHLLSASAKLAETLLRNCPQLRMVATSREPLRIRGEMVWQVPPLQVPVAGATSAEVLTSEAARLFLERATLLNGAYAVDPESAAALARLCRRLDGIPLAIELAAARTRAMSILEIAARLDDRFRLLDSGARDAPVRHQALRATLDWTYDALSPPEKRLFARLGVFAGGFGLASAEAVCSSPDLSAGDVSGLVFLLVDKSLVMAQPRGSGTRYQMLETIGAYSAERLAETDDQQSMQDRHLDHFLALAERVGATVSLGDRAPASDVLARELDCLEQDEDNMRRALGWALTGSEVEKGLRLAGALSGFWFIRHRCMEGRAWLQQGLRDWYGGESSVRAKALVALAAMNWMLGEYRSSVPALEEALSLYRQLDDALGVAEALNFLGAIAAQMGEVDRARALLTDALEAWDGAGARRTAFESLDGLMANLGSLSLRDGDYAEARRHFQEALAIARELGDDLRVAEHLFELGRTTGADGDYPTAESMFEQALPIAQRLGYTRLVIALLVAQAQAARIQGKVAKASMLLEQGLSGGNAVGDRLAILRCFEELEGIALSAGEAQLSAVVMGAADAIRDELTMGLTVAEGQSRADRMSELEAVMGRERLELELCRGRAMSADDAVADARTLLVKVREGQSAEDTAGVGDRADGPGV